MKHQTSGDCCVRGSGGRRKKKKWLTCLHNHTLAVGGSRVGIEARICPDELSVKQKDRWKLEKSSTTAVFNRLITEYCVLDNVLLELIYWTLGKRRRPFFVGV